MDQGNTGMQDFLVLIHHQATGPQGDGPAAGTLDWAATPAAWPAFLDRLSEGQNLAGGSSLGEGQAFDRYGHATPANSFSGYLRLKAISLEAAIALCQTLPDFLAGATIEVLPLVEDA
jgi:hypothetical protein